MSPQFFKCKNSFSKTEPFKRNTLSPGASSISLILLRLLNAVLSLKPSFSSLPLSELTKYVVDFFIVLRLPYLFLNNRFNFKKEKSVVVVPCEKVLVFLIISFHLLSCDFSKIICFFYLFAFAYKVKL